MALFAEDIDDVGEIGLGRLRNDIRRGRPVMAHPHVERAAEPEREAALGLVELHRGNADVHHDAVHCGHALRRADLRKVGESVLDQGQPAIGLLDQIEAAGNRRPVAVDADDLGSLDSEDRAAVAAGAEGRVDIDATVLRRRASRPPRGRERRYGVAQPGSCAVPWRIPACKMEDGRERAHCASNLCASPGFSGRKAANRHDCRLWPGLAPPHFRTEFAGLPWHFERERGPRPSPTRFGSSPLSNGT